MGDNSAETVGLQGGLFGAVVFLSRGVSWATRGGWKQLYAVVGRDEETRWSLDNSLLMLSLGFNTSNQPFFFFFGTTYLRESVLYINFVFC